MKALTYTVKHLCILVVGIALALVFVWIVRESDVSASVLSLSERAFIEKSHRDAAYKKEKGNLEVFISPQLQNYTQFFVSLLFSPSEIALTLPRIQSPYQREVIHQSTGTLLLQITDITQGKSGEGIIIVPFSGDAEEITVEFVSDQAEGGVVFALGALNAFTDETAL